MKRSRFSQVLSVLVSLHLVLGLIPVEALAGEVAKHSAEQQSASAYPEFVQSKSLDGVTVRVKAGEGAFPEDAVFEVAHLTDEQIAATEEAVTRVRPNEVEPVSSHAWNVRVDDSAGNELKLAHEQKATLEFCLEEAKDKGLKPQVYAITEDQGEGESPIEAQQELEGVDQVAEQTATATAISLEFSQDHEKGLITVEVDELSSFVIMFVRAEDPLSTSQGGNAPPVDGVEEQAEPTGNEADKGKDAPAPEAPHTNADKPATTDEVTAQSATENIVGEVFANTANEALTNPEGDDSNATLEQYPTENHEESYYKDSLRLRKLHSSEGHDMGFLVYRDSFLIVSQEEGTAYDVTQSENGRTAYVTPAIDPATLEGKTGIVFLREDVGHDVVLVFAEGQVPTVEGNTLVVPLAATEDLALNQLFSDGNITASADYKGPRRLGPNDCVIAEDDAQSNLLKTQTELFGPQSSPTQPLLQAQASFKPTIHPNPSGTNWKATIDYSSVSIDDVGAHVDVDIWDLKFDLVVDLALGFDFDVTSSGASNGRESCEVIGLDIPIELFTLHYAALFEAQFDSTPVHIKGRMNTSMGCHMNPLFGFSVRDFKTPIALKTFELVHPERDANKEVSCYLGTGFYINQGFLSLSVDLGVWDINIGPLVSLNHLAQGGTYYTGRLEKNQYDPHNFSRTRESVHECAANNKEGCYDIRAQHVSEYRWFVKLDLYFKSWSWNMENQHSVVGNTNYYNSLTHKTGLKQGVCPYLLFRVPVQVLTRDGTSEVPVPNMGVSPAMDFDVEGVSAEEYEQYTEDTTNGEGRANIFLPYVASGRHTIVASGTYANIPVVGSSRQPTDMKMGVNDEVKVYINSADSTVVEAQATWDSDKEGNEESSFVAVVQMRNQSSGEWKVVGWCNLIKDASMMAACSDGTSSSGPYRWSHRWPKYSLVNGAYELNEFRVLQLRRFSGPAGTSTSLAYSYNTQSDAYFMDPVSGAWHRREYDASEYPVEFSATEIKAIEEEVAERAILPDSSDPYASYFVQLYTDSHGLNMPRHTTTFLTSYDVSQSEEGPYDVITTTMNNRAVADVNIHKIWNTSPDVTKPSEVYVALMQRPYAQWASYAREQGVPTEWVPVLNPIEGPASTLHELMREGVMSWANVYDIEYVPLSIAKVSEADAWTCNFKVLRYRNGIPMEYEAVELSNDVISSLLNYEYHSNQIVNVVDQWSGGSLPGLAYATLHDARYTANVTNTSADQEHTIGGSIFWYNPQREDTGTLVRPPDHVIIHVYDEDGHEVGSTRVNRADFEGSYVWTWSLTGDDIHSYKNYTVYEDFDAQEVNGALFVGWHGESHGLDVVNHFTGGQPRLMIYLEAGVDAPADSTPTGDALQVELVNEKGQVIGTYPLEYDASEGRYGRYELGDYAWSTFAGRDIEHYSVRVKNPQAFSSQYGNDVVTTFTTSCTYEYAPPSSMIGGDLPMYTFHITGVVRTAVRLDTTVEWKAAEGASIPDGAIPDSVTPQVLRNEDTTPTTQFEVTKNDGWKATYTDQSLAHLSEANELYTYSLAAPHVNGFASAVTATDASTLNPKYTITYTYLGETGVDVAGAITWTGDEGKEHLRPTGPIDLAIVAQTKGKPETAHTVEHIQITPPKESGQNTNTWSVKDLPRCDSNGEELEYSALQETAYGYTTTYVTPTTFDEGTRTWTCDATNKLTGYFPLTIKKEIAGDAPAQGEKYTFNVTPIAVNEDKSETPEPVTDIVHITGEGEAQAEFLIASDGLYLYSVVEQKGADTSCVYDTSPRTVLIVRTTDEQGEVSFRSFVADTKNKPGANDDASSEMTNDIASASTQIPLFQALTGDEKSTVEFVNRYPGITVEKKWDIDLEGKDKPATVDFAIQKKTESGSWETVSTVTLGESGTWKKSIPLPNGPNDKATYRVRELRDRTVVEEVVDKVKGLAADADAAYTEWLDGFKSSGYFEYLPSSIQDAANDGLQSLQSSLGASSLEELATKLMEQIGLDTTNSRIVHDSSDDDKGDATTNEVVHHVGAYASAVSGEEAAHNTKYRVSYDDDVSTNDQGQKSYTSTITNKAILEIDVIKRWIALGVEEEDMPDSAWLVLMCKPKAGALDNAQSIASAAGIDLGGVLDYEFPVINPIEGGQDPLTILGKMAIGVDLSAITKLAEGLFGIKVPTLALQKVTKDDNWRYKVVDSKYTAGIPMEYKGAELTSEIIRLIVKYLTNGFIDSPVSFNPFDGYISIPTKAIRTVMGITDLDLSQLKDGALEKAQSLTLDDIKDFGPSTLLDDWHLMANAINVKVDWSTDDNPPDEDYPPNTVHGQKIWDDQSNKYGMRPQSIKVYLLANGQRVKDDSGNDVYVETSQTGGWRYTFASRPTEDENGDPITYTVEEEPVAGYTTTYDGYNITNTLKTRNVPVTKAWNDLDNRDGLRPESVTVRLRAGGKEVAAETVSSTESWKGTFENVPEAPLVDGKVATYTVSEDAVDKYTSSVTGNVQSGFTITNTHVPEIVNFSVTKTWDDGKDRDGMRPDRVTVRLLANGVEVQHKTLTEKSGWQGSFSAYKYENGQEVTYTVREDEVEGYTSHYPSSPTTVSANTKRFSITNVHSPETVTVRGTKVWDDEDNQDGKRPDSVTMILYMNGRERERKTVTEDDSWEFSFSECYKRNKGQDNVFTVGEVPVEGYSAAVEGSAADGFTITNTHKPETITVKGRKTWSDANNQDGKRPDSVIVKLMRGDVVVQTQRVSAANGWQWEFTGVPKYHAGQIATYDVAEEAPDGYTPSISGNQNEGFVVRNTHTPEIVSVEGQKTWNDADDQDGKRPDHVTVRLLANGREKYDMSITERNGWRWSFPNLPKYENGKEISYAIVEDPVDGYTSKVEGYNVTNTHEPETMSVSVAKIWDDAYNQDGKRPESVTVRLLADGSEVRSARVTAQDQWRYTFEDVPKYKEGQEIDYSLAEDSVAEYTTAVEGTAASGFVVTNTHAPVTAAISGSKTWNDGGNQDNKRPRSITVRLRANGAEVSSKTVTAADEWQWDFGPQPVYKNGERIAYTVTEDPVEGYTATVNGYNITNSYTPEQTQVYVFKLWDDRSDAEGKRPESVTIHLLANGVDTGKTLVLNASNGWVGSFDGLAKNASGTEIDYTVTEDEVEYYESQLDRGTDDFKNVWLVTNAHETTDVDISVQKQWVDDNDRDGLRPESVRVWLVADGLPIAYEDLTEEDDWACVFEDFPEYRSGSKVDYRVAEDPVDDYTTTVAGSAENGYTITNTHLPEATQVTVYKLWSDGDDEDGVRPLSLTVDLYANDVFTRSIQLSKAGSEEENVWTATVSGLYVNAGGTPITYTVREQPVTGYQEIEHLSYSDESGSYFLLWNYHEPTGVDIVAKKVWDDDNDRDGLRPETVRMWLVANGTRIAWKDISADDDWGWTFEDFPKKLGGQTAVYTIEEEPVDEYDTRVTGSVADGFTVTNGHTPREVDLRVYKVWDDWNDDQGIRPSTVTVHLWANGKDTGNMLTLSEETYWQGTFGKYKKSEGGKPIEYTVTEDAVPEYESEVEPFEFDDNTFFFVTNTHDIPEVTITGTKTWEDDDNAYGERPERITVRLYADGLPAAVQEVDESINWTWSFEGFPEYDAGRKIVYTVSENALAGYTPTYNGYDITNKRTPEQTFIEVHKAWDDQDDWDATRPESVTVHLLANGKDTGKELELRARDGWRGTFTGLDVSDEDGVIDYTVEEEPVNGYGTEVFGNMLDGYTILNSREQDRMTIRGTKVWDDDNDRDGLRPESVEVILYADGHEEGVCEASAANGWTWEFEGVLKSNRGKRVEYTVGERQVPGYTTTVDGSAEGGFVITNAHVPATTEATVRKVWDDEENLDGSRPAELVVSLSDGTKVALNQDNEWTATVGNLPRYDKGTEVVYSWAEDEVPAGYELVSTTTEGTLTTLTNRHVPLTHVITYDLNGGTYKGSANKIKETYAHGTKIKIHEKPVREGYEFLYWKGSTYMPGDAYTVTEDHTFVAQWKKLTTPTGNPSSKTSANGQTLARTSDTQLVTGSLLLIALLGVALIGVARRRRT